MLCLANAGCGGKNTAPGADVVSTPGRTVSNGLEVETVTYLTGSATRVLAGPLGDPQGLDDLLTIEPWGPVVATHTITLPDDTEHVVNQLASPDPFTAMYQLEDGTLRTTNEPVELCWDPDYHGPEPAKVNWVNPEQETVQVYERIILVWFDQSISEQELELLIDTYNLNVVMSWFEGPDAAPGGGMEELGGGESANHSASNALEESGLETGSGIGAELDTLTGGAETGGNEIAYFEFEYDPTVWPTLDDALAFFETHPNVECVVPNLVHGYQAAYSPPNDYFYQQEARLTWPIEPPASFGAGFATALGVDEIPAIVNSGYSDQVVAVIDCGVARPCYDESTMELWGHPDFGYWSMCSGNPQDPQLFSGKIVRTGIDCWPSTYDTCINGGQPMFNDTEHFGSHGTSVAGLIAADTNNNIGIPALAPKALILPVRAWYFADPNGGPGWFDVGSIVKAYRALRMDFSHGEIDPDEQWDFQVRVVNCSYGSPEGNGTFTNIDRDLKKNDRLYVASAGNNNLTVNALVYPAAFENVLGVTGLSAHLEYNIVTQEYFDIESVVHYYDDGEGSNYWTTSVYPVSGLYAVYNISSQIPPVGVIRPNWCLSCQIDRSASYVGFKGTSAASPCVAALAFHLYDIADQHNSHVDRHLVMDQIIDTIDTSTAWYNPPVEIAGLLSFSTAVSTWPY